MKRFRILSHPVFPSVAIKIGWSWLGFFFGYFWLLYHKIWSYGFGIPVLSFIIGSGIDLVASPPINVILGSLLGFCVTVFIGVQGHELRIENLLSRGYTFQANVEATNSEHALAIFMQYNHTKSASNGV
ncbi:MAG: hypothetical protein RLY87_2418 [Chloroflexota bacterium]